MIPFKHFLMIKLPKLMNKEHSSHLFVYFWDTFCTYGQKFGKVYD